MTGFQCISRRCNVRPSVGGHGCHDAVLGRPSGLRLSPFWASPLGPCQGPAIAGVGAHPNSYILDTTPVVSRPAGASGRDSGLPSIVEGFTQTTALPSLSPEPPRALPNCVSFVERSARHFSFSTAVARQLPHC